jgi:hypothetical protein
MTMIKRSTDGAASAKHVRIARPSLSEGSRTARASLPGQRSEPFYNRDRNLTITLELIRLEKLIAWIFYKQHGAGLKNWCGRIDSGR